MLLASRVNDVASKKYYKHLKPQIKDISKKIRNASKDGWFSVIYNIQSKSITISELHYLVEYLEDYGYEITILDNELKKYEWIEDVDLETGIVIPELKFSIHWD